MLLYTNDNRTYFFDCDFYEKETPKKAGFRWSPDHKSWYTQDREKAISLIIYADHFTKKMLLGEGKQKTYYTDGFSNPKRSGYVITNNKGDMLNKFISDVHLTCNEAELKGVICACNIAETHSIIYSDSLLAVNMSNKTWKGSEKRLIDLANIANRLIRQKSIKLVHTSRNKNLAGLYVEKNL